MEISDDLKQSISYGDYTLIAELYADRHTREPRKDFKTVSKQYVEMVVSGDRPAKEGTAAEEIMIIAIKYLQHKRDFRETILI
jgi:hypothetical protein